MSEWNSSAGYWDDRYENNKTGWEHDGAHPALTDWIASGELQPCSIAVPGCGRGHEAVTLAQEGFEVTAIDFAEAPLQATRGRLSGFESSAKFVQSDVLSYRPQQKFNAVYEQTCLCAIEPAMRSQYENSIFEWLKPGGKLFALFMQTKNDSGEPPFHCDVEDMKTLFSDDRWDWQTKSLKQYEHPSGVGQELGVVLRRKEFPNVG